MVITCPSCSARYRLNPEKIQGRGAKITCPKCSHVFVVFTDKDEARAKADSGTQPRVKSQSRPASGGVAPPTRNADTTTGAFKAVGIKPPDTPPNKTNTNENIRIVAPGTRSTRRVRTIDSGEMPVATPPSPERASAPSPATDAEIESASDLDFRSVGIKTWKVKVAIGLIYDFSDIATLKKYLADKKVTPDDLISQNNKDWIRIGDIGDLDQHFIDAWRAAKAAVDSGQVALPEKKKSTATGSHNTLGHASATHNAVGHSTGSFRTSDTGSARALSTGAYGVAKEAPRRRKKAKPPVEEPPKRNMGVVLALLLVVGLLAVWRMWPTDGPGPVEDVPPIPVSEIKLPDAEREQIRDAITKKLEDKRAEIAAQADLVAGGSDPTESEEEVPVDKRDLVPVKPSEQTVSVPNQTPIVKPPTGQYARPRYEAPKQKAPLARSDGDMNVNDTVDPAKMYYDAGQKKLKGGDYGSAQKMFTQATNKNPKCAKCFEGLAEAEQQLGNAAAAAAALKRAAELGAESSVAKP